MNTLMWDSRIRTLAVFLPALALMAWIGSEIASEDFIIPAAIVASFVMLVFFTVFVKTVRVEAITLCFLLTGYLVGNRGFAELSFAKPLYPGELVLGIITACIVLRFALTRELPDFSGTLGRTVMLYCVLGLVRLALDYKTYKMDAIRDSAMVYYGVYYFFGRQLAIRPSSTELLEKCLRFAFTALVPIAIIQRVAPGLLLSGGHYTPLFQKDDLLTTFTAVGVFIIYTNTRLFPRVWMRSSLIVFYMAYVVIGIGRASLGALIIGSFLLFIAGQRRFFLYPIFALVLGVTVFAGLTATFGSSKTADLDVLVEKIDSMVDVSGQGKYNSAVGDLKASNNEWRRKIWQSFIDEGNVSPVFGRGFGFDFVASFEDKAANDTPGDLRSAHNYFVTFYGRTGLIGLAVFAAITVQIILGGIRAALAVKAGYMPMEGLGYWCSVWAILVSSVVGVVLEGPVGAIVFWSFLGIASHFSYAAVAARHESLVQRDLSEFTPVFLPPERRPVRYGAARRPVISG